MDFTRCTASNSRCCRPRGKARAAQRLKARTEERRAQKACPCLAHAHHTSGPAARCRPAPCASRESNTRRQRVAARHCLERREAHAADEHAAGDEPPAAARTAPRSRAASQRLQCCPAGGVRRVRMRRAGWVDLAAGEAGQAHNGVCWHGSVALLGNERWARRACARTLRKASAARRRRGRRREGGANAWRVSHPMCLRRQAGVQCSGYQPRGHAARPQVGSRACRRLTDSSSSSSLLRRTMPATTRPAAATSSAAGAAVPGRAVLSAVSSSSPPPASPPQLSTEAEGAALPPGWEADVGAAEPSRRWRLAARPPPAPPPATCACTHSNAPRAGGRPSVSTTTAGSGRRRRRDRELRARQMRQAQKSTGRGLVGRSGGRSGRRRLRGAMEADPGGGRHFRFSREWHRRASGLDRPREADGKARTEWAVHARHAGCRCLGKALPCAAGCSGRCPAGGGSGGGQQRGPSGVAHLSWWGRPCASLHALAARAGAHTPSHPPPPPPCRARQTCQAAAAQRSATAMAPRKRL